MTRTTRFAMVSSLFARLALGLALIGLAGAAAPSNDRAVAIAAAVERNAFAGQVVVGSLDRLVLDRGFGPANTDTPPSPFATDSVWPWESVTKQVVATLVMQQVAAGRLALDSPADRYLPALGGRVAAPTLRALLQHRSGLRNPDDTPMGAGDIPAFYTDTAPALDWCLGERKAAGGAWRYNNCDYIVLGALLERVTGRSLARLYADRIAKPLGLKARFVAPGDGLRLDWPGGATAVERTIFARFGGAGGLAGSARDLLTFDRALLRGKLLSAKARVAMWEGDPKLGYQALGQWSFEAPLQGCAKPVRIIERRGGIGRFQSRNVILPDLGIAIIVFTNRGDYDFGEIWQGKGFSYDLLSAAACG